jgi:hypothetical protein
MTCRFLAISVELLQYSVSYWLNSAFWSSISLDDQRLLPVKRTAQCSKGS